MATAHELEGLLDAARAGAPWALQRLYEELAPLVAGYLRLQGVPEVDDVTSEVFLGVFRGLGGFTGDASGFRSWVFTIAHHRLVDEQRRAGRRPAQDPLEDDPVAGGSGHGGCPAARPRHDVTASRSVVGSCRGTGSHRPDHIG